MPPKPEPVIEGRSLDILKVLECELKGETGDNGETAFEWWSPYGGKVSEDVMLKYGMTFQPQRVERCEIPQGRDSICRTGQTEPWINVDSMVFETM